MNTVRADSPRLFSPANYDGGSFYYISNGPPLEAAETRIFDFGGNDLGEDMVGIVHIRGAAVLKKYYGTEENTTNVDGWLNTGDVGFIHDGEVFITSRYKDMFFINGQNYYCGDLDEAAMRLGACEETRFAGYRKNQSDLNDTVVCFIKHIGSVRDITAAAKETARHICDLFGVLTDRVIPVDAMQRTESGKLQRFMMLEKYLSGGYASAIDPFAVGGGSYIIEEIQRDILRVFREQLKIDIDLDDNYIRFGVSSKNLTLLYTALERRFKELVSVAELYEFQTVRCLSEYIVDKNHSRKARQLNE